MGRKRKCNNGCDKFYTTFYTNKEVFYFCKALKDRTETSIEDLWDKCLYRTKNKVELKKVQKILSDHLDQNRTVSEEQFEENRRKIRRAYNKSVPSYKQIYG